MTELEKWENGDELSHAIVKFGDPVQLTKFRNASDFGPIQAYRLLLYADLFANLT